VLLMEKGRSYDGMLILTPGSKSDPSAVACLSEITGMDNYYIRVKLNARLPLPLCRFRKEDILGDAGDRLVSAGIRFYMMDRLLFDAPFKSIRVTGCREGKEEIIFYDPAKKEHPFPSRREALLLEGVYRTNAKDKLLTKTTPQLRVKFDEKKRKQQILKDYESLPVIFLYVKGDPIPLILIDIDFDYGFLGPAKSFTAVENFKKLKERIESVCGRRFNLDMACYAFTMPMIAEIPKSRPDLKKQKKEDKPIVTSSNEEAVNHMSRLMYGQWCAQMEPAQRFLSADYNTPAGRTDISL